MFHKVLSAVTAVAGIILLGIPVYDVIQDVMNGVGLTRLDMFISGVACIFFSAVAQHLGAAHGKDS